MGVMDTVMKYTFAPLQGFWSGLYNTCEIIGYSRAASELARMGLHEEAKNCMMQIKSIRSKK
jgi:hypothetical protein